MSTKFKIYAALLVFSATLAAARLARLPWHRDPIEVYELEPITEYIRPPLGEWPELKLIIEPSFICTEPEVCRGLEKRGDGPIQPFEDREHWHFEAILAADGQRFLRLSPRYAYEGKYFDIWFTPRGRDSFHAAALGTWFTDCGMPNAAVLAELSGSVTVNSLDWRVESPLQVRCEFRYRCRWEPKSWETIEFCSTAVPTRDEQRRPK